MKDMISQGYPLWAVDQDGAAYAVVGWSPTEGGAAYPMVVDLVSDADTPYAFLVRTAPVTFTTTDPSAGLISTGEAKLRASMTALADRLGKTYDADARWAAGRIRQELDK